jgi:hypothetical protein
VLITDDTGFIRNGTVGWDRSQYTGTSRKIDTCRTRLSASHATSHDRTLMP